jgi:hypothetical protein
MIATSGCGDDYAVIAAIRDARSNHGRARRTHLHPPGAFTSLGVGLAGDCISRCLAWKLLISSLMVVMSSPIASSRAEGDDAAALGRGELRWEGAARG